ncbi:hypothetical protein EVAR_74905_1 [Eumeta japonica]|uniref:Uncharacterized protein n=1 Tax=Eumeta variegata TaxID=151549 RepID=A0A4C1UI24_EUMVA|nr:hypothetical protein EVAR_74905_1 [Eumeta japonica]
MTENIQFKIFLKQMNGFRSEFRRHDAHLEAARGRLRFRQSAETGGRLPTHESAFRPPITMILDKSTYTVQGNRFLYVNATYEVYDTCHFQGRTELVESGWYYEFKGSPEIFDKDKWDTQV